MKLLGVIACCLITLGAAKKGFKDGNQEWGYTEVRPKAHMFWWLYYTTATENHAERPLIIWLQGGPGYSSTALGNFLQFGPYDLNLKERESTLIKNYNILYIDSPVGTGFSYIDHNSSLSKDEDVIINDLNATLVDFLNKFPKFKTAPLYIFGETYGAKMAVDFAYMLDRDITVHKRVEANLKGVALGDPWISPIDAVSAWVPYLWNNNLINQEESDKITAIVKVIKEFIDKGDFEKAKYFYSLALNEIRRLTNHINIFNIKKEETDISNLDKIMNVEVHEALNLPEKVKWELVNEDVYNEVTDFMVPANLSVQMLLEYSELKVAIYNSEYDLYVTKDGTMTWINELTGNAYEEWKKAPENPLKRDDNNVYGTIKKGSKLATYSINGVGNVIGADNPEAMLTLYDDIINKF